MSRNKTICSRIISILLIFIIAISVFAPSTVFAATMPGLKSAVTEENIMAILDKYDPDGVYISWKRTYDSDGYKIYRKAGKESFIEIKDVVERSNGAYLRHSYTDKTVKSGKVYSYYVVPYKNSGGSVVYGKPSIIRTVETLDSIKLTSARYVNGVFKVKWTAPDSFVGFEVAQVMEQESYTSTDGDTTATHSGSSMTTAFSHDKKCRSYTFEPQYGPGEYKIMVRGYVQRNGRPLYSNWSNEITVVVK